MNTAEKFLLLIQHPEKSRFIFPFRGRDAGFIGAILLDLLHDGAIDVENGRLIMKSTDTNLSAAHSQVLNHIQGSARTRRVRTWITRLSKKSGKYIREVQGGLERKKLIRLEHKKFLVFKYCRSKLMRPETRKQIIYEIRDQLFHPKPVSDEKSLILAVIDACGLYSLICRDRQERKACRHRIRKIMKTDDVSRGVSHAIQEVHAAIAAAVAASKAAAVAASS
ncbi:MAG TPA: GPP34 family phosphoprotein [Bacteroides sp.]|nr:GPP34 family phosphoprotein [Bacteroides sp.]